MSRALLQMPPIRSLMALARLVLHKPSTVATVQPSSVFRGAQSVGGTFLQDRWPEADLEPVADPQYGPSNSLVPVGILPSALVWPPPGYNPGRRVLMGEEMPLV